ncbi:MAG TPA: hypothetical protein VJ485_04520 [archaeon]|nr:hypothetical protein [archaeon]
MMHSEIDVTTEKAFKSQHTNIQFSVIEMDVLESWEVLKDPESDCLHGLPKDVKDREYPCVDIDLLIEDLDKGKIHCLTKKGRMPAVIIGNSKDYYIAYKKEGTDKSRSKKERPLSYFIDVDEEDSALICIYQGRNELRINALKVNKGTYLNERLIGEFPERMENVADLKVGTRRFRIVHKYGLES